MTDTATVASNLRRIEDMATRLRARAIDRATDREMPGGEAMVLLAGVGSREVWEQRVELAEERGDYEKASSEDPDRLWSALQVLWFWSEDYRRTLGHDHDDPRWRPSLASEAAFLRNRDVADWIWDNEEHWDDYAADVARARTKLESVLMEGERAERSRVVCGDPECVSPRKLIRVYAKRHPIEWACEACGEGSNTPEPCDCGCEVLREVRWESDAEDDLWKCGGCGKKYNREEVEGFFAKQLRTAPSERWMQVSHAVQLLREQGWQERVIRGWIDPDPKSRKEPLSVIEVRREPVSGRREVLWSSIWRRHLLEQNVREQAAKAERRAS